MDVPSGSGHGERLMALAAVITAIAGLVAAIRGVHAKRRRSRRKRRVDQRLKTHVRASEKPLDSDNNPDRIK